MRAGLQQAALTGSAEPVVAALKQIDERFARANQPRLEPVRRAVARDLDRVKAASVADVATLSIKLDEAVRLVDELPLLSAAEPRRDLARGAAAAAAAPASAPRRRAASAAGCRASSAMPGASIVEGTWSEIRSLVRITRIDQPEAMLVAPDQAFFLKENVKLRLLNARLSLLARQFDAARGDLRWAKGAIERYFDRSSRRTQIALDLRRAGRAAVAPVGAGAARRHLRRARRRRAARASVRRRRLAALAAPATAGAAGARGGRRRADALSSRSCASRSGSSCCSPSRSSRRRPSAPTTAWRASTGARGGSTCRSTCSCCCSIGTCFLLVAVIQGDQLADRPAAARARMAHRAARSHRPGGVARRARAVLRRPLHARAEVGAARARDPGRDARAGAGQRVHRPRPPARRRQRASGAEPRPARRRAAPRPRACRSAARRRARPRRARACSPPSGRSTTATRRARSSCSTRCRSASRGELTRCA